MSKSTTARKDPGTALLHVHGPNTMHAKSTGPTGAVYVIKNDPTSGAWSCSCPAGRRERLCYHVLAAMQRYAGYYRPLAIITPASPEEPPPTPAAPAVPAFPVCTCTSTPGDDWTCPLHQARRKQTCQAALYDGCACPRCSPEGA